MTKVSYFFYAVIVLCGAFGVAAAVTFAQNYAQTHNTSGLKSKTADVPLPSQKGSAGRQDAASAAEPGKQSPSVATALTAAEERYRQSLTQLITPLLKFSISQSDKALLDSALKALERGDPDGARRDREKISIPAGRKFITWSILRSGFGRSQDYRDFLTQNPLWPERMLIQRRLEQSLFIDGGSAQNILAQFKDTAPKTDAGYAAIASAHLALGNQSEAQRYAAKAWCGGGISARREGPFLQRFGSLLTNADHTCRLNRLLVDNLRWRSSRRLRAHSIRRVIKLLDKQDRKKATARLSAFLRQPIATKWMNNVPAKQREGDLGYAFQRIQQLRLRKQHSAAWRLLAKVPVASEQLINVDAWWEERHANALNAIKSQKYELAASFVDDIRPQDIGAAKDQAFFAGWLALRQRNKPKVALSHFTRLLEVVSGPLSTSMAHYWLGRTHAVLGQDDKAAQQYKAAARYRDTFHGLIAAQTLAPDNEELEIPLPVVPTQQDVKTFLSMPAVQATMIARLLKQPRRQILRFYRSLASGLPNEAHVALLAQLAAASGDGQLEVRTGKIGVARGFNTYIFSYPLAYLPEYEPLRTPPETALVLGIARQESEFNTHVVSGAGARGILQIMPGTARDVCRNYKVRCNMKKLLDDASYNVKLATAYAADLTEQFDGSYILTFTGYNAGPGRTRQWLRQLGDPRSPDVQALDWIYQIPFEETRLYTQKILSNVQVYRARLGIKDPLRIINDMNRGRKKS